MNAKPLPSYDRVRELFDYAPESGVLSWRVRNGKMLPGSVAGVVRGDGQRIVGIDGISYRAHRIIWLWMTGSDPAGKQVDHEDTDRGNNRWKNLRLATNAENSRNRSAQSNNKSGDGLKGAYQMWNGTWYSRIWDGSRDVYLGTFPSEADAHAAYAAKAKELFGEFARAA